MSLVIATTPEGKQVIADSKEAQALGYTPVTSDSQSKPAPEKKESLGVTAGELISNANKGGGVLQTTGSTYYIKPSPQAQETKSETTERIVIPTSSGINIILSPSVTAKVGGVEGLKQIYQERYMRDMQMQSQNIINRAVLLASQGKDAVMHTPEEMLKIQAYENMITERTSRVETFALYGMNVIRTAIIGYGSLISLAYGVPIEKVREQEFAARREWVRNILERPVNLGWEMADIGTQVFLGSPYTYKTIMSGIAGSSYAAQIMPLIKPIVIGTSVIFATKGAYESVPAAIEFAKEPSFSSATRLAGGLFQFGAGALGLYAGWKMPTYYSGIKWDEPVTSKELMVRNVDLEKGITIGKAEAITTQHGVSEAYYGLMKKDIWIKGFPETRFIENLKTQMGSAITWNPSAAIEKISIGRFQLGESYFYPTGYSESVSFVMKDLSKSVSISTKGFLGEGKITFPDFTSASNKIGEISKNVVFEGANIRTGYTISFAEPKMISNKVLKEVMEGADKGFMITRNIYKTPATVSEFKQFAGGEYKFEPMKTFTTSLVISKEPMIFSASGGGGSITISKPPSELTLGGTSAFDFEGMQPDMFKQFAETARITSTSLWKPFYSPGGKYREETTYLTYPPSEKNMIIQNLANMQITMQRSMNSQKISLNLGSMESQMSRTGLQSGLGSQSSLQKQIEKQLQLQSQAQAQLSLQLQEQQLQHLTMTMPKQIIKITTPTEFLPDLRSSSGGASFKIILKSPFGKQKEFKVSSFIEPTASMYSLERAFSKFGKGSLARGPEVEKVFRNLARSSGLSLEFPAAEFLKEPRSKRRKKRHD